MSKPSVALRFFPCPQRSAGATVIVCSPRATAAVLLRGLVKNLSNWNPCDRWGRFMGSCVSHLLLFPPPNSGPHAPLFTLYHLPPSPKTPPQHMPISLSPSVLLRRRKKESEGGFSSIRPFSTRLLEMTEIVSLMTHYTRVFSGTRCCRAFVPIEKCKKPPSWIDFQAPMKHVDLFRREILFDSLCLRGATNILCHSCSDVCGSETQAGRATTLESYTIHTHRHNEQYGMLRDSKGLLSLHF